MVASGQTIDRYELLRRIGDGGMAEVWAARQRGKHGFERLVAIKIIHSRFAEDAEFRKMFLDEARIVAAIEHRNVGQLLDVGETGDVLYLVMEYVDGDSLFALIAPERRLPAPIALRVAAEACAGLEAVHRLTDSRGQPRNVVHRDVSPQNILLSRNGEVKLIDFGIAHARDRSAMATDIGTLKGKLRYMAPEQVRRESIGPQTDIFALGAVLFRMLAGRAPYAGATDLATLQALAADARPLTRLPEDVPAPIAAIISRAIATSPHDRYSTASDMQAALESALGGQGSTREMAQWLDANLSESARERRRALTSTSEAVIRVAAETAVRPDVSTTDPTHPALPYGRAAASATVGRGPKAHEMPVGPAREESPPGHEPPPDGDGGSRSFMDVSALVAQARRSGVASPERDANVSPSHPSSDRARSAERDPRPSPQHEAGALPVQAVAAPTNGPRYVGPMTPAAAGRARSGAVIKLSVLVVVLLLVVLCVLLLLPMVVRDRVVASAREAGFDLSVENVGVGFDGVSLRGVGVKAQRSPGISATIPIVHLNGLTGKDVRIHDPQFKLSGSPSDIEVGLVAIATDARTRFAGTPSGSRHLSIIGARIVWDGIHGEGSRLSASDVGIEVDSRGPGAEEVRGSVGRFEIVGVGQRAQPSTLGPWASSFETSKAASRIRVMFDPPVPDGPSLLYVRAAAAPAEVTLRIPRSPFSNLGVKPESFGLPATASTEIEASVEGKLPPDGSRNVHGTVSLWGVPTKGHARVNVKVVGSAIGAPDKPFELEKTIVQVSSFTAGVSGSVLVHDGGLRLDAMFKSFPMTCASVAKDQAKSMGPLMESIQAFGQTTGAFRVSGNVNVSGVLKYDTAAPDEASVTWLAKETCGVSIFGL